MLANRTEKEKKVLLTKEEILQGETKDLLKEKAVLTKAETIRPVPILALVDDNLQKSL